MKNMIGIFQGKQAKYNILIMNILWDNGPLTAWEITGKIQKFGRVSLHATLNKRLRDLEKKQYLRREERKWFFQLKGIIVSLLIQKNSKPWNNKWDKLFDENINIIEKTITFFDIDKFTKEMKISTLQDWNEIATHINNLMQKGVINLDVISNDTLLAILMSNP